MGIVYIMPDPSTGVPPFYANIIEFGPGSPPPRPHPTPPPGYPSHPIHYPPGTHPGYPGWGGEGEHPEFPIYLPPIPPVEPPSVPDQVVTAVIAQSATPKPPPTTFPPDAVSVKIWHGKGTLQYDWWLPKVATTKPPSTTPVPTPHR